MFVPLIHILTILSLPINTAFATPRFSPNRHNGLTVKRSQNTKTHAEGAGTVRYYDLLRTMTVRLRGGNAPYNGDRLFFPPVGPGEAAIAVFPFPIGITQPQPGETTIETLYIAANQIANTCTASIIQGDFEGTGGYEVGIGVHGNTAIIVWQLPHPPSVGPEMVASLPAEAWTVLHNYLSAVTGQGIDPNAAGSSTGPGTFSGAASAAGMLATIQAEWDDPTPAEDFDETTPLIDGVEEAAEAPGGMCGIGYCDLAQGCGGAECGCFPLLEAVGWAIMFGLSQASSVVGRCLQSRGPLDFWDM